MKNTALNKFIIAAVTFLICILLFFLPLIGGGAQFVCASTADTEEGAATNVIDDLYADSNFDVAKYPVKAGDYSVEIIQLAENTDGGLYVYTYQPSGNKFEANALKMSLTDIVKKNNEELKPDYNLYKLELISAQGVFHKYRVLQPSETAMTWEQILGYAPEWFSPFKVSKDPVRYYDVVSISRPATVEMDGEAKDEFGNVTNYKAYKVNQLWTATTENGNVSYAMTTSESIEITSQYAGYINYLSSTPGWLIILFGLGGDWACHAHFLAFSTDLPIDKLIEAKITYKSRTITNDGAGAWLRNERVINYKEKGTAVIKDGAFSQNQHNYSWERIQTVDKFILDNDIDEATQKKLAGKQWVLNFTETGYDNHYLLGQRVDYKRVEINEIDVLQLEFEKDGQTFNLGVVADTVTESRAPDKTVKSDYVDWLSRIMNNLKNFFTRYNWLFWLIVAVLILSVAPVLSHFFPPVKAALKAIGKGLVWIICAPFRGIAAIVKKIKERKNGGADNNDS